MAGRGGATTVARFTNDPDRRRHFEVRIPAVCDRLPVDDPESVPGPFTRLAHYVGYDGGWLEVEVFAGRLTREVAAGDAAAAHLAEAGEAVLTRLDRPGPAACDADLYTERVLESGTRYLRRVRVVKDGDRLFRVDATVPFGVAGLLAQAAEVADSLRLLHPERRPLAEPLATARLCGPAGFRFDYPASWRPADAAVAASYDAVELLNLANDEWSGSVTVALYPARADAPLPVRLREFTVGLRPDVLMSGHVEATPLGPVPGYIEAASATHTPESATGPLEVKALGLVHDVGVLMVGMVSPSQPTAPWMYAVNCRAYGIVVRSLTFVRGAVQETPPELSDNCMNAIFTTGTGHRATDLIQASA